MKKAVATVSKILLAFMFLLLLLVSFSSCKYMGKEIVSIEKINIDYMGGIESGEKLYLQTGEIYSSYNNPCSPSESYTNKLEFSYDPAMSDEVVNAFYSAGLFNLLSSYKNISPVMDGGGWELIITYSDGTTKKSSGSNAGPYSTFQKAGRAFYDITGGDFLYAPSGEYKYAPSITLNTRYSDENNNGVYVGCGISAYQGCWRNREMPIREDAVKNIEMMYGFDYTVYVHMQDGDEQFTSAAVYAYKDSYADKKEVEIDIKTEIKLTGVKRSFTFIPEADTNYVIYLVFELGNAEYRITTVTSTND